MLSKVPIAWDSFWDVTSPQLSFVLVIPDLPNPRIPRTFIPSLLPEFVSVLAYSSLIGPTSLCLHIKLVHHLVIVMVFFCFLFCRGIIDLTSRSLGHTTRRQVCKSNLSTRCIFRYVSINVPESCRQRPANSNDFFHPLSA